MTGVQTCALPISNDGFRLGLRVCCSHVFVCHLVLAANVICCWPFTCIVSACMFKTSVWRHRRLALEAGGSSARRHNRNPQSIKHSRENAEVLPQKHQPKCGWWAPRLSRKRNGVVNHLFFRTFACFKLMFLSSVIVYSLYKPLMIILISYS